MHSLSVLSRARIATCTFFIDLVSTYQGFVQVYVTGPPHVAHTTISLTLQLMLEFSSCPFILILEPVILNAKEVEDLRRPEKFVTCDFIAKSF